MNELDEAFVILDVSTSVGWYWQLETLSEQVIRDKNLHPEECKYAVYLCHKSWITDAMGGARPLPEFFGKTYQEAVLKAAAWLYREIGDYNDNE